MAKQPTRGRFRLGHLRLATVVLLLGLAALNFTLSKRTLSVAQPEQHSGAIEGTIIGSPAAFAHSFLRNRERQKIRPSASNESTDVVIVGGGIAGLAAAWALRKRGVSFVLLELEEQVGGARAAP